MKHLYKLAIVLFILSIFRCLLIISTHSASYFSINAPLNYGEGPILQQALQLLESKNIYRPDIQDPPWTISNYPPVYHLLQLPGLYFLGPEFRVGRAISVLAIVLCAVFVGRLVWLLFQDRIAVICSAFTFLSFPFMLIWGPQLRVDSVALCFSLLGLVLGLKTLQKSNVPITSSFVFIAAAFTRQTSLLFGPLVLSLWMIQRKQYRQFLIFWGILGAGTAIIFIVLNIFTHGGFRLHTITANVNEIVFGRLALALQLLVAWTPIAMVVCIPIVFAKSFRTHKKQLLPFLLGGLLSLMLVVKEGSDLNYMFDFGVALSVCFGAFVAQLNKREGFARTGALLITTLSLNWMLFFIGGFDWKGREQVTPEFISQLVELVKSEPDPILSDDFLGAELLRHGQIYFQPFERTQLTKAGLWDQKPLLETIAQKNFSIILMNEVRTDLLGIRWTPEMLTSIHAAYEKASVIGDMSVYRPRS